MSEEKAVCCFRWRLVRLFLALGFSLALLFVAGCSSYWGTGFRLGTGLLEIEGERMSPKQTPPGYIDWHVWQGSRYLKFDAAAALIVDDELDEKLLTLQEQIASSRQFHNNRDLNALEDAVIWSDSQAQSSMWGVMSSLQVELPNLPLVRPYAGAGVGYFLGVNYNVEGEIGFNSTSRRTNSGFDGKGGLVKWLIGGYLSPKEGFSLRVEYQRLSAKVDLKAVHTDMDKSISLGGHFILGEAVFNFYE